jgi:peptidoglycan-associated lipoprotein
MALLVPLVALAVACGGRSGAAPARTGGASQTEVTSAPAATAKPVSPSVSAEEELARACDLTFGDVAQAPKFGFDEADLSDEDYVVLGKIGRCVTTGPLRGRSITLVGRADPRGSASYNMRLGERRAKAVESFLVTFGVARSQITVTSQGERDATGKDEATWRTDRRVDILLGK